MQKRTHIFSASSRLGDRHAPCHIRRLLEAPQMTPVLSLFSILSALTLGAISPGPSFLFVTRTSVALSRRDGIAAAVGMGLGAALVCALALVGLRAVISQAEWAYLTFKILGGAYLCYLAWRLWRGAAAPP